MLIRIGTKIIWTAGLEYVSVSQLKLNAAWLNCQTQTKIVRSLLSDTDGH